MKRYFILLLLLFVAGCGGGGSAPPGQEAAVVIANAGSNKTATTGTLVLLDASSSRVGQGKTASYFWTLTSKPTESITELYNATDVRPFFIPDTLGTYSFTLTVSDGDNNATATVNVTVDTVNTLIIGPTCITIPLGLIRSFEATEVTNAGNTNVFLIATWTSSCPTVARIVSSLATATGQGVTVITATKEEKTASSILIVGPVELSNIWIQSENHSGPYLPAITNGQSLQLTAKGSFSDGIKDITEVATWSISSDSAGSNAVTVSDNPGTKGLVTTTGNIGTDTVLINYNGFHAYIYVSVN